MSDGERPPAEAKGGGPGAITTSDDRLSASFIDGERLWSRLQHLSRLGAEPASHGGGIVRPAFSGAHAEAVRAVAGWMREAGLDVGMDATGNLFGLLAGTDPDAQVIGVGSHLDTVPHGGAFDGSLGVLAGLEAVAALAAHGWRPKRPVAVLGFADEEGNTFGIGVLSAQLWTEEIGPERYAELVDAEGLTLVDRVAAFDVAGIPTVPRPALAAYVEAHVEQGPLLERRGWRAAAVESIVGIARTTVVFHGVANHAGTTPMEMRRDATWAAAELVLEVRDLALKAEGRAVGTVGLFEVSPGVTNVVPGSVRLRVEFRSPQAALLDELGHGVERAVRASAERYGLSFTLDPWHVAPPVAMDRTVVDAVQYALSASGLPVRTMPSWAGHDAKVMARHMPTGMVFVPSIGGISHAPDEATDPSDCAVAAQVLAETLLRLDDVL